MYAIYVFMHQWEESLHVRSRVGNQSMCSTVCMLVVSEACLSLGVKSGSPRKPALARSSVLSMATTTASVFPFLVSLDHTYILLITIVCHKGHHRRTACPDASAIGFGGMVYSSVGQHASNTGCGNSFMPCWVSMRSVARHVGFVPFDKHSCLVTRGMPQGCQVQRVGAKGRRTITSWQG